VEVAQVPEAPIVVLLVGRINLAKQTVPILQHWLIVYFLYSVEVVTPPLAVPAMALMAVVAVPVPPAAMADLVPAEELVVSTPPQSLVEVAAAKGLVEVAASILILATLQRLGLAAMA
jgi:hypothetical protein